ncbi:MAG: hypothetical protein P4M15_09620 [Alphaproteobacteria bacterium]|nr:hypothetical protein [Alphaproteobacteria bacterium]
MSRFNPGRPPLFTLRLADGITLNAKDQELVERFNAAITAKGTPDGAVTINRGAFRTYVAGANPQGFFNIDDLVQNVANHQGIDMNLVKSLPLNPDRRTPGGVIVPAGFKHESFHA